ncbi:DNA replication regulator sld3 [Cyphellophora attinorum]|uniref:DNA replication regulator sld3 n=1 Tax=Cyphellophora attinorum TaxID=1664694 RepID=A0A0N1H967_9EURO|nr:DNA replication regulator sld3 [Phialophora attinorum]KPI43884.1 DNA replication regulator sld3 [Phialophora attinorum]
MEAPTARRPLAPASDTRLNAASSTTKKRKRDDSEHASTSNLNIVGKAYRSGGGPAAVIFSPVATLSRADLPFIWLDNVPPPTGPPSGYLLEANGSVLQILAPKQCMVARLCPNGRLYALEKVQDAVYTAMMLRNSITEDQCRDLASGTPPILSLELLQSAKPASRDHVRSASMSSASSKRMSAPPSPKQPRNKKGALARKSILARADSQIGSPSFAPEEVVASPGADSCMLAASLLQESPTAIAAGQDTVEQDLGPGPAVEVQALPETAIDVNIADEQPPAPALAPTDDLRNQYLETLYTRTSLAFYAKGPLSRARNLCMDPEAAVTSDELKDIYTSLVLPSKKLDTKYKESVPVFLKHLTIPPEEAQATKKKPPKKVKLGKDGFYTGEFELLRRWWDDRAITPAGTSNEAAVKRHTEELRNREAEMQLLLILEIMIVESLTEAKISSEMPVDPVVKVESVEKDEVEEVKKKRKQRSFVTELDALLDRLCIWHTVTIDDFLISPEKHSDGSDSTAQRSKDKLKEFCADIIVPFYASKLPRQVKNICKKLGGPNISPQRPSLPRPRSSTAKAPAPSSTKPVTTKTSLQRVLSQDQELRHGSPPILSRSSSSHQRSGSVFKREPSEVMSRPSSRASMQKSMSFSNREIDLDADAKVQETKRKRLEKVADQKKELAAAIEALKKPNRTSAGVALMDELEKRTELSKLRVQITATPRKDRLYMNGQQAELDVASIPTTQPQPEQMIPSSTLKPTQLSRPSAKKRAVLSAIHDTPSRDVTSRKTDPLQLSSSVEQPRPAVVASTPSTSRLRPDLALPAPARTPVPAKMSRSGKPVLFTPLKRTDVSVVDAFRDAPEIPERAGKAMDRVMGGKASGLGLGLSGSSAGKDGSLYAQLGWDDDDDDDLL